MILTKRLSVLFVLLLLLFPVRVGLGQVAPAKEVIIELKGGDLIHGRLAGENEDSIIIVSPILGTLTLSREKVISVTELSEGENAEEAVAAKKKAEVEAAAKKKAEEEKKAKGPWSGSVNVGLTYSDATKTTTSFNLSGALDKKTEEEVFHIDALYFYSKENGNTTDNDVIANLDQTWLIEKSRWSFFAKATYQWDEFQGWEHRLSAYGGAGYAIIKEKDLSFTGRFGAGGTYEYTGDRQFDPQLLFQLKTDWTIDQLQSFTGSIQIAPKVTEFSNYLLTLSTNYKVKFGKKSALSLNFTILSIYDSNPTEGGADNDLKLILSLGYNF